MGLLKNKILCTVFFIISVMNVCTEHQTVFSSSTNKSITSYLKDYVFLKMRSFGFNIFYNYLNSMLVDYKNNNLVKYKMGMQYISGRYLFQDINQLYNGETVLHQVTMGKDYYAMKILLFLGADSQVANGQGVTPYDIASRYKEPMYVHLFDDYKNLCSKKTALDIQTMHQKYYVKIMYNLIAFQSVDKQTLTYMIDTFYTYRKQHPVLTYIFLYVINGKYIDEFINVSDVDITLLQQCMYDDNIDLAQILLYLGADPIIKNRWGLSAFELAIKNKNIPFLKLFWPYVGCDVLRSEMYPWLVVYKHELLECANIASQQGSISFRNAVYRYFGTQSNYQEDQTLGMIVDFWN